MVSDLEKSWRTRPRRIDSELSPSAVKRCWALLVPLRVSSLVEVLSKFSDVNMARVSRFHFGASGRV